MRLSCVLLLSLLAACGQAGPLTLPDATATAPTPAANPPPPVAPENPVLEDDGKNRKTP